MRPVKAVRTPGERLLFAERLLTPQGQADVVKWVDGINKIGVAGDAKTRIKPGRAKEFWAAELKRDNG